MENDKIKFRVVFNQLFAGNEIGKITYFHISISSYMGICQTFSVVDRGVPLS